MRMQQNSRSFQVLLLMVFIAGIVLSGPSTRRRSRVRRQNMKVRINATEDTVIMKFVRPNPDTKLEGYILGYGSSMFSKQFIQLPENGKPYETEFDAEPKYLIAVQPIPVNEVKKQCTGKVELQKPLHLVIGSITPTSVLLSWGTLLKTPYDSNVMDDCLEDGHYTVRYREKNRKWNYQTCPTSDTVIDNLKPNTFYEFAVQPNSRDSSGSWSSPVLHNINRPGVNEKNTNRIKPDKTGKPLPGSFPFSPRNVFHNKTLVRPVVRKINLKTTLGKGQLSRPILPPFLEILLTNTEFHTTKPNTKLHTVPTVKTLLQPKINDDKHGEQKPTTQSLTTPRLPQVKPRPLPTPRPHQRQQKSTAKPKSTTKTFFQGKPQLPLQIPTQSTKLTHLTLPQQQPLFFPIPQPLPKPTYHFIRQTEPQPLYQPTSRPMLTTVPPPQLISHYIHKTQSQPHTQPPNQAISTTQLHFVPFSPQIHSQWFISQAQTQTELTSQYLSPTQQPMTSFMAQEQHRTQPTSQPTPQTYPKPKLTSQPILQTQFQSLPPKQFQTSSQPLQKPNLELEPQIATKSQKSPPTTHAPIFKHQTQSHTLPQLETQPQPKPLIPAVTMPPLALHNIPHTKQTQLKIPTKPQAKPTAQSQTPKQLKPSTKVQQKHENKSQPNTLDTKPRLEKEASKSEHKQKGQTPSNQKEQTMTHHNRNTRKEQSKQWLSFKNQTKPQPDRLPKPHPVSISDKHSQLGLPSQPQTRTFSDPTKFTQRKTAPTAPSPPEGGKPLSRPALATKKAGVNSRRPSFPGGPRSHTNSSVPAARRNYTMPQFPYKENRLVRPSPPSKPMTSPHISSTSGAADGEKKRIIGHDKSPERPKENPVPNVPINKGPNLVGKPSDNDKPMDLKQGDKESILKRFPLVTAKPKQERRQQTTTAAPVFNSTRFDIYENSSIFRPLPITDLDSMGNKRFTAPHVIYKTDKKPEEPCSITSSMTYFPDEEGNDQNVTGPPRIPPSNLTVVTVEGCSSFVILDWQKSDNETKEYEVVSTAKGPNGEEVSILTTNQTHTAVENLQPKRDYVFKVTPKNERGTGPPTDPVTFSTESADPRVSEYVSGKGAIWTQFPFKADAYSECNGKQFVKRTWYRKFVGIQLCNSLRYKIYLSDTLNGKFYNIGDQTGYGEDHCQFVDSFLDGRTGTQTFADQLPSRLGYFRALRQEPVHFGEIGGRSHVTYVGWYECGRPIPGKW
ncbi:target of Nesh-SH3 isoform X3 [Cynoglossus semilaevis]|uniref:Target of Nesh-SH3 n=1 Tax=Cynoglossus semilaevis TaxID=244447 RepID=A0A3P8V133_CYNSE|nr:target of Nesh-SH3 isoform X3 [Cynoglossus semilaevis]